MEKGSSGNKDLWQYREANEVSSFQKTLLASLIVAGIASVFYFADWWFRGEHIAVLPLFLMLTFIFWWGILRTVIMWVNYLGVKKPVIPEVKEGLSVAIFTTSSPGEPLSMFEKTLEACSRITYPHTTYLLDDTQDPRFKEVAERHGAVWLELIGIPGAKAGKINAALKQTNEAIILVLDPDHIPFPNFLDKVSGFFANEKIGFVQVAQAYYNQSLSFTARGAAEQTYGFYGPTQMGMHGYGCAVAIGSNCTFRREALESIGGHGIGLAEDLVTSIRLHAKGWQSVYAPVVVSRGLVPEDFGSFCKQQLKWARGVMEVLFVEYPKAWKGLSGWQRLSYFTIGTYYFAGLTLFLFILFPYLYFWTGILPANMAFESFLVHWLPIGFLSLIIYLYMQQWLAHPHMERGLHWRGMVLKFATWPVFLYGILLAIVNAKIPYIPTSKQAVKGWSPFARPLLWHFILFVITLVWVLVSRRYFIAESALALSSSDIWGMMAFASLALVMVIGGLYAAWQSRHQQEVEAWKPVDLAKLNAPG
jgi:cellulose synthase (UDP-forming)